MVSNTLGLTISRCSSVAQSSSLRSKVHTWSRALWLSLQIQVIFYLPPDCVIAAPRSLAMPAASDLHLLVPLISRKAEPATSSGAGWSITTYA